MKNFAIIGVAGFVAPRHLKAIRETNNNLLAALDKFDQVGVLDSYFPSADFFTEFERFDRHIDKLKRHGQKTDYVSICTPNYLHDAHIRFALRHQATAICEKPVVLNPWNVDGLVEIERETGKRVFTILQLRLHPALVALRKSIAEQPSKIHDVTLTYISARGNWYGISWKGDVSKSGGIATNIGIHFFDLLIWVFGRVTTNIVHARDDDMASGYLEFERARVRWFLSIREQHLPESAIATRQRTFRSIQVGGEQIEFSDGFTDLHTASYRSILAGEGFGLEDARQSIQLVHDIRVLEKAPGKKDQHPFFARLT